MARAPSYKLLSTPQRTAIALVENNYGRKGASGHEDMILIQLGDQ